MVIVIEYNNKWAFLSFLVSAFLVFLFAEVEAKLLYICFLGYYPILKSLLERINRPIIEWIIKILVFNVAVILVYKFFSGVFGVYVDDLDDFGKMGIYLLLGLANFVFVLYDITVSKMAVFYLNVVRPKIRKFL